MASTRTKSAASAGMTEWIDPTVNPEKSIAQIEKIMAEANTVSAPVIEPPADDLVSLPGGLIKKDKVIRSVQVKELTGEDEESLARASQSMNPFTFIDRLLKCGVIRIGEEPAIDNEKLLSQMLVGDREALILGIRQATYGDIIEIKDWICPACAAKSDLAMEVSDIPVVHLSDPIMETSFQVKMRKGGFASVRLANGSDQVATFDKQELTQAQRETILLSRCVISLTDKMGVEKSVAGFPSLVREMSVPDRHAILNELANRQPGPKYDKVEYKCESCDNDVKVAVTIGHLFLDFGWI